MVSPFRSTAHSRRPELRTAQIASIYLRFQQANGQSQTARGSIIPTLPYKFQESLDMQYNMMRGHNYGSHLKATSRSSILNITKGAVIHYPSSRIIGAGLQPIWSTLELYAPTLCCLEESSHSRRE